MWLEIHTKWKTVECSRYKSWADVSCWSTKQWTRVRANQSGKTIMTLRQQCGLFFLSMRYIKHVLITGVNVWLLNIHGSVRSIIHKMWLVQLVWDGQILTNFFFSFLSAFTTLRKATVSCVMSVPSATFLSVCVEQLGSHWTDFHKMWWFFGNMSRKFKFDQNLTRITGTLHEGQCKCIFPRVLLTTRNV